MMRGESHTSFEFGPAEWVWSRMGETLGWMAIPWMAVVLVVEAAVSQRLPLLLGDPYSPARMAIPLIGLFPLAWAIAAAIIGPRGPFRPLFVDPQPRATIDEGGIAVRRAGVREETHVPWEQIGGLALDASHEATLVDASGMPLIEVPRSLLFSREKRTRNEMCLSAAVVQARPDRYTQVDEGGWISRPVQFRLRTADDPPYERGSTSSGSSVAFVALLVVLGIVGLAIGAAYALR